MTAVTRFLAPDNGSDVSFRNWGKQLSDDLTSFSLRKTADAGQIDWSTASTPPSVNIYSGYEIRTFTDSLQAVAPVYFKIRYGTSNYSSSPRIEISLGSGSNGFGGLTGVVSGPHYGDHNGYYVTSTPQLCVFSGSPSRFTLGMFVNNYMQQIFCLERTKNALGQDTGEGVMFTHYNIWGNYNQFIPQAGTFLILPPTTANGFFTPDRGASSADGTTISFYPNYFFRGGTMLNPPTSLLCYFTPDVIPGSINPVAVYGNTLKYLFIGSTPFSTCARGGVPNTCLALLYE